MSVSHALTNAACITGNRSPQLPGAKRLILCKQLARPSQPVMQHSGWPAQLFEQATGQLGRLHLMPYRSILHDASVITHAVCHAVHVAGKVSGESIRRH
jgi:hypothetical protein